MANRNAWHTMDIENICARLDTNSTKGLGRKQASARAKKLNIRQPEALRPLFIPSSQPWYKELLRMLFDPIMLLTLLVAALMLLFTEQALGVAIVVILLLNAVGCAFANAKARNVWCKMQLYSNPMIKVVRSGKLFVTDARNVLPGDLVILSEGDVCPADVRLDKGNSVHVTQLVMGETKMERQSVRKSGDVLYMPGQEVFNPHCENIVYAGSVIEQGFARGIVVETGRYTYIGAVNGIVPGTEQPQKTESVGFIKRYFSVFSAVQACMILPMTFLMAATMRYTLSFAECFMITLALCCTVVVEHLLSLISIARTIGIDAAASELQKESVCVIKNNQAMDKLCDMTDLLLLDSSAISDGRYHLESVYAGGSIYNLSELQNSDVQRLVTELYLYRTATRPLQASERDALDAGLAAPIDALIKHVAIDTAAIELTRVSSYVTSDEDVLVVHNRLNDCDHDILLSPNERLLQSCTHIAHALGDKEFDDSEHMAMRTLCRIYRESGYRVLLIANSRNGCITLVGMLAFANRVGYQFDDACKQLIESGVRVSAFMDNTPENVKILTDSTLIRDPDTDILTADAAQDLDLELGVAYGSYRAYLGFSKEQIAQLIEGLKSRGATVAAFCVDNELQSLQDLSDTSITCDAIEYRSPKVAQSYYDKMPVDGKSFSSRASQNMRRHADVVLRRAGEQGGGLHGILTGRARSFAVNYNVANIMTYLVTVQFFRAVLLIVPALFGTYTLTPVSLLITGILLDALFVWLFALATPDLSKGVSYPIMRRLEKPITYNAANVMGACISALLVWLCFVVLQILGLTDAAQSTALGFVTTYLLQGVVFVVTLREYAQKKKKGVNTAMLAGVLIYVVTFGACLVLPVLRGLTGCAGLSLIIPAIAALALLIYYLTYRILSASGLNLHK